MNDDCHEYIMKTGEINEYHRHRHRFNLGFFYVHIFWECPHINRPLYNNVIFAGIEIDELY